MLQKLGCSLFDTCGYVDGRPGFGEDKVTMLATNQQRILLGLIDQCFR